MKVVIDTCILKLATFPGPANPSALIVQLGFDDIVEWWGSPAILDEYSHVMDDEPRLLSEVFDVVQICYPLHELSVIRHEPDNRFVECALAVNADYLVTVNTAPGHFDQRKYGSCSVATPGRFVNLDPVRPLIRRISTD